MKIKFKRITALFAALAIMITALPLTIIPISAAGTDGESTEYSSDGYLIVRNYRQLRLAYNGSEESKIRLGADIDCDPVIITIFVVTAVSNGANLNDGMDGMAAGNSAIIGLTLGILAYVSSHIEYAGYLNIMYIPGSEELVIFICVFIGALIGFLWYNAYPAQVFMGDTGSLTIGGIIAVYAIIIHKELLIPILCGIFLVENLSVILQRLYYKAGKRKGVKQRLFKRTPIHDHFRTSMSLIEPGCSVVFTKPDKLFHESKITIRFWIVTIVLAAITIITLKIR